MSANAKISDVYLDWITCSIDILGFSRDVASIDGGTWRRAGAGKRPLLARGI